MSLTKRLQCRSSDAALAGQISQRQLPSLILWSSEDRLISPDHGRRFHRDLANSQLKIFEGLGHVPHEENPKATVQTVVNFLSPSPPVRSIVNAN